MSEYPQVSIKNKGFTNLLAETIRNYEKNPAGKTPMEQAYNPNDPSYRGFLQKSYDAYRKDQELPLQDVRKSSFGELRDFSYVEFWDRPKVAELKSDQLKNFMFDFAFQSGPDAMKTLQKIVGVKKIDGKAGPKTNKAIEKYEKENGDGSLLRTLIEYRRSYDANRMDLYERNNNLQ